MNTPFVLNLHVRHVNVPPEDSRIRLFEFYRVRATISHNIGDILELIWINSENYFLKPAFLSISYNGTPVGHHQQLCDIMQTAEAPFENSAAVKGAFILTVDYLLLDSTAIPRRDPVVPLFDVIVRLSTTDSSRRYRESLFTTIGVLRDRISEQSPNRDLRGETKFALESTGQVFMDVSLLLSEVLQLDVAPLHPVVLVVFSDSRDPTTRRFHIKLNSAVEVLQEGNNLFEVSRNTLVDELKHEIIRRMDHLSVRRTFFDQIKLYYATQFIDTNSAKLYDILLLDDSILLESQYIIAIDLEVSENTGTRGIFSRQFWRDLRSPNRFEFLPNRNNDLRTNSNVRPSQHITDDGPVVQNAATSSDAHYVNLVRPPRIVLENGIEWNMTGRTFEEILSSQRPEDSSLQNVLVEQSDMLLQEQYEFSLLLEGQVRKVLLNTSQCIIVNHPSHQPYILLSPAGLAKLNVGLTQGTTSFRQGIVQNTLVIRTEANDYMGGSSQNQSRTANAHNRNPVLNQETGEAANPQQVNNAPPQGPNLLVAVRNQLRTWAANFGPTIIRFIFILYVLGLNLHLTFLYQLGVLKYIIAVVLVYLLATRGQQFADYIEQNVVPNTEDEAIRARYSAILTICKALRFVLSVSNWSTSLFAESMLQKVVHRRREYEYIARQELKTDSAWFYFTGLLSNVRSDFLMMFLTMLPALEARMEEALEKWRQNVIEDLENDIEVLQDKLAELISDVLPNESPFDVILRHTGMPWDLVIEMQEEDSDTVEEETQDTSDSDLDYFEKLLEYYLDLHGLFWAYDAGERVSPRETDQTAE